MSFDRRAELGEVTATGHAIELKPGTEIHPLHLFPTIPRYSRHGGIQNPKDAGLRRYPSQEG